MEITIQTLTPLWTGGIDQTCDRLHETGIIGSLRWWYEALVRGLGGYACDPTSGDRCPDKDEKHCVACELFGCTGWARKFRLRVLDANGQLVQSAIQKNIKLVLEFVEMRPIYPEEEWLLAKAVGIAAKYGALGGKTTLKPQKGPMGADHGIVQWIEATQTQKPRDVEKFLKGFRQGSSSPEYPDLRYFFFFSGVYLTRSQMNALLGLDIKGKPLPNPNEFQRFLQGKRGGGEQDAVSKKLFSFQADNGRIWGYAKDSEMRNKIIEQIQKNLGDVKHTVKTGEEVLHEL